MTMLAIHGAALASKIASYHEFLSRYSKSGKVVYGFVEGKDDPSFYRGFLDLLIPDDWSVELWPAGNKDQVYRIHGDLDWRRFPKKRICFFVDRDLSDLIPEQLPQDENIYVTRGYSIENDVATKATCNRLLTEVCGFAKAGHDELDSACELFEQQLGVFFEALIPVMAWILAWRRGGRRPNLNDLAMHHLFRIEDGKVHPLANPNGKATVAEYLHAQCNVPFDPALDIAALEQEVRTGGRHRIFSRGKYVFWFLIEFCRTVHRDAKVLFRTITSPPKMHVNLSHSTGMSVVGVRARMPPSLRAFFKATFGSYIEGNS